MKHSKRGTKLLALLLSLLMLSSAVILPAAILTASAATVPAADEYESYLISLGFPEYYASRLAVIHISHPTWTFTPVNITQKKAQYTWEYVLYMETDANAKRNLIANGSKYDPYRHPTNTEVYDSGLNQASTEAVSYFMDSRNFLNERLNVRTKSSMKSTAGPVWFVSLVNCR